ncbi:hypothetical protein LSAT2_024436 [Lamellibrachia satsuma]|nr:hypothetical protein LSAT2_024436 [Lamellibrachia satsuma]
MVRTLLERAENLVTEEEDKNIESAEEDPGLRSKYSDRIPSLFRVARNIGIFFDDALSMKNQQALSHMRHCTSGAICPLPYVSQTSEIVDRRITTRLDCEVWHQYDGVINKEADSGVVATIKQLWDKNKEQRNREMAIATHAFLPKLETFCTDTNLATAEQALRQIYNIRYCMKQCDETANILADYLRPYIEQLDQMRTSRSEEPPSDAVVRLSTAMVVIYIMIIHDVPIEEEMATVLCDALLLRTPGEDHICHDFEAIKKNFPEFKTPLTQALFKFLDICVSKFHLDRWLLAVPLSHFLCDCSKPYQSVYDQLKAKHVSQQWWGVQHFKPLVDKFKHKTYNKVDIDLLLSRLEPLFPVDQLLQRTLMAAMNVKHIEEMITSMKIAPEVCMANLTFFLKKNEISEQDLKQKTAVCIDPIVVRIQELQKGLPNEREVLEKYAHIITLISMDFLDAALNQMTGTSCYKTLESVMSTVAASITTLYKAAQGDSAQPESKDLLNVVEQMFNIATEKIACWLKNNLPYSLLSIYTNTLRDVLELEEDQQWQ